MPTVAELRRALQELGLSDRGRKAELEARLAEPRLAKAELKPPGADGAALKTNWTCLSCESVHRCEISACPICRRSTAQQPAKRKEPAGAEAEGAAPPAKRPKAAAGKAAAATADRASLVGNKQASPAGPACLDPKANPVPAKPAAVVSILGLEKNYSRLDRVYGQLSDREQFSFDDSPGAARKGRCTEICGVDFARPLTPLPADAPFATGSAANMFAMLVWNMLEACESGSIGGDACRMADVLCAASNEALAVEAVGARFEHLFGLTLAISNHGLRVRH